MKFFCISSMFLLSWVDFSCSWVFTDVNYLHLARMTENNDTLDLSDEELRQLKFSLIYPSTKWCGPGNVADGYDDLGTAVETDKCCRDHDNCPDVIPAGQSQHNLTNDAFYSRLSCACDEQFRQCLHTADTYTSNQIGYIYFNALSQECYRNDYPIKTCIKKGGWLNRKCLEYEYDMESAKKYQWFHVPNYK